MPEITKTDASRQPTPPAYIWFALLALTVFVYFYGLSIPFLGPDEPRYAQVAREMLASGDWITPTLGGHHWFEKPVLLYWLEIVSFQIFGVNEFAARLGPALFGLGTVASLWILGRSIGRRDDKSGSIQFANLLALVAASTLGIMVFSRGASFDIIITFPVTAALVSFFVFDSSDRGGEKRRYLPLVLFYSFIGIALLAKGLIGIVFPLAIIAAYYLLSRRFPGRMFLYSLVWGTTLAVAIAAIWYWPMFQRYGYEFIDEFFIQHHFQRFTSNKYRHPQPFYFFLWVMPLMTLPWMPFFLAAVWKPVRAALKNAFRRGENDVSDLHNVARFAVAWMLVPLAFFSISGSKLPGYILPAVPAATIITGIYLFERVRASTMWQNIVLAIAVTTFAGAILILTFIVPGFADSDSVKPLITAATERGYSSNRVLTLHNISHNAEFYAAGRLVRDVDGEQLNLSGTNEIIAQINAAGGTPVLVLLPVRYVPQLTAASGLKVEIIKDNGELAISSVSLR
jgi:4-amino-4-deoxy-L-arabinose transferase-like glycosyltransferase